MFPRYLEVSALFLLTALACAETSGDLTEPGVQVGQQSLPALGGAYHGAEPHRFLGGSAELPCGSHGLFTSAVEPPTVVGETVLSEYFATFTGQLVLAPPLVPATVTSPLAVPVYMVERITLASTQGTVRTFDTELVTFELGGPTTPAPWRGKALSSPRRDAPRSPRSQAASIASRAITTCGSNSAWTAVGHGTRPKRRSA